MRRTTAGLLLLLSLCGSAAARPFGEKGQYIVTTDAHLDFQRSTVAVPGAEDETTTEFAFILSGDYSRFHRVTFGAEIGFAGEVGEVDTAKGFRFGGRVGYVVPLASGLSLWPRAGIGYANTTYQFAIEQYTVSSTRVTASLPFVFNPSPLVIVGVSPTFDHDFRATTGDSTPVPKTTAFGVHLMLGFWFE